MKKPALRGLVLGRDRLAGYYLLVEVGVPEVLASVGPTVLGWASAGASFLALIGACFFGCLPVAFGPPVLSLASTRAASLSCVAWALATAGETADCGAALEGAAVVGVV